MIMTDVNDDFVIIDSDFVQTTRRNRKPKGMWSPAPFRLSDGKDETRHYLHLYRMWERRNKGSDKENPYDRYLEGRWLYEIALESVFSNVSDDEDVVEDVLVFDEQDAKDEECEEEEEETFFCYFCDDEQVITELFVEEDGLCMCIACHLEEEYKEMEN